MHITVGNKVTGVTEAEATNGRRELADLLNRWWSQKSSDTSPQVIDVSWGALNCQLQLNIDQSNSPQIILKSSQSAPRSIRETINAFLIDTCNVASVNDHFKNEGLDARAMQTAVNIASKQGVDNVDAPLSQFRVLTQSKMGMFRSSPVNKVPQAAPAALEPTKDGPKKP